MASSGSSVSTETGQVPGTIETEAPLDREVEIIERALRELGSASRRELRRRVGARYWGPGRFSSALREAIAGGRVRRLPRGQFPPGEDDPGGRLPSGTGRPA